MSSQKVDSIKIPQFDKENYNSWKKKMILFIRTANLMYLGILENGPFVPHKLIPETVTELGDRVPQRFTPKDPSEFSDMKKDKVALDISLQLIIVDSLDNAMLIITFINCKNAKKMWDTIELPMEATAEMTKNKLDILTSQYEAFKSLPRESITLVFKRYNKLLNDLSLQGKIYSNREISRKFHLFIKEMI